MIDFSKNPQYFIKVTIRREIEASFFSTYRNNNIWELSEVYAILRFRVSKLNSDIYHLHVINVEKQRLRNEMFSNLKVHF